MKATGIIRKVDDLGRIVIPKELRKVYDINEKDQMEVFVDDDCIILRKFKSSYECILTGEVSRKPIFLGDGKLVLSEDGAKRVLKELLEHFGKEHFEEEVT